MCKAPWRIQSCVKQCPACLGIYHRLKEIKKYWWFALRQELQKCYHILYGPSQIISGGMIRESLMELDFEEWGDFAGGDQQEICEEWRQDEYGWSVRRTACCVTLCMNGAPWNFCSIGAQNMGNSRRQDYKGKSGSDCKRSSVLNKEVWNKVP